MEFCVVSAEAGSRKDAERFYRHIRRKFTALHRDKSGYSLRFVTDGSVVQAVFEGDTTSYSFAKRSIAIREKLSLAIAEYIVSEREPGIVRRLIIREYDFPEEEDRRHIEQSALSLLNPNEEEVRERRIGQLAQHIRKFLEEHQELHIDGLIAFRMQEYTQQLRETVDYVVDEYLLDKQYEEFIGLLKYFVHFQESQIDVVNLMHTGGSDFAIFDGQMLPLKAAAAEGVIARIADHELELEDVIVSSLISLSPGRIIIHTRDPEVQIISTIRQIFGERTQLCEDCPRCKAFLDGSRKRGKSALNK
ncbi:putative sporulation protein YtxC [Paenibacillus tuaregi]|uniref:putative sporulation protein YtxC n=1 Tax=Paenibacillus tuaregi TaxID=1816681 RepID=UPI000837B984|nr:putative sporulation protein YtxC [Paenibacillus tuaregi]